ncbi:MAG: hypothetical protein EZS28_028112 [Streblomastix strix]|uniref:Uncharacterized protein n=1 Tax=Streblomastix strix TaxID=222440 RepID=A0A5J4V2Q0_9EUKA|nr:MAG: hypothetical protein EZS28_028112 [Streblomastix strix]
MPKKGKKAIATRPIFPIVKRSIREKQKQQSEHETKILQLMRQRRLKLKKSKIQAEQQIIEDKIRHKHPQIQAAEAHGGVFAISNTAAKRRIYTEGFLNSLLQELYETNIRINDESKLIGEKYMENIQGYDQNIKIKQMLSRQLDSEFVNQSQGGDLGQSSMLDDIQPEFTLVQEKLIEAQRQKIESDIVSSENLNTVYHIGALYWGRPSINDIYGRQPFETYDSCQKYDQFDNPIAYIKKSMQIIGKKNSNMKRNYVPTSQLIQTAEAQSNLYKKLTKSAKIDKKN